MRKLFAIAALGVALSGFAVVPAVAQVAEREAAVAACSGANASADACNAAIARFVAVVQTLPAAQKDALLADLVITLGESASPATQAIVAAAIVTVSTEFTDPQRAATAVLIADAVEAGEELDPATTQALASAS